ncbi:hypothetical protein MPTK1_4g10025 [Marchantia polymorpha subsp. ruderalis]
MDTVLRLTSLPLAAARGDRKRRIGWGLWTLPSSMRRSHRRGPPRSYGAAECSDGGMGCARDWAGPVSGWTWSREELTAVPCLILVDLSEQKEPSGRAELGKLVVRTLSDLDTSNLSRAVLACSRTQILRQDGAASGVHLYMRFDVAASPWKGDGSKGIRYRDVIFEEFLRFCQSSELRFHCKLDRTELRTRGNYGLLHGVNVSARRRLKGRCAVPTLPSCVKEVHEIHQSSSS